MTRDYSNSYSSHERPHFVHSSSRAAPHSNGSNHGHSSSSSSPRQSSGQSSSHASQQAARTRRRTTPSRESSAAVAAATATLLSSSANREQRERLREQREKEGLSSVRREGHLPNEDASSKPVGSCPEPRSSRRAKRHEGEDPSSRRAKWRSNSPNAVVAAAAAPASKAPPPSSLPDEGKPEPKRKSKRDRESKRERAKGRSRPSLPKATDDDSATQAPRPLVLLGDKPRGIYECDYCRTDLTRVPRVRCAVCPDFDLCLDCFATSDHVETTKLRAALQDGERALSSLGEDPRRDDRDNDNWEDKEERAGDWLPRFRHTSTHGYVVADSTRFALFPSFRGVLVEGALAQGSAPNSLSETPTAAPSHDEQHTEGDLDAAAATQKQTDHKPFPSKNETESNDADENILKQEDPQPTIESTDEHDHPKGDHSLSSAHAADSKTLEYVVVDEQRHVWTAEEDLRLLDGILTCGLGNWPDIAEHVSGGINSNTAAEAAAEAGLMVVGGNKSAKRCMERYLDDFLGRYGHILPPYTMVPLPESDQGEDGNEIMDDDFPSERKRRRRNVVEEEVLAPTIMSEKKKTKYGVVPTESLDGYNDLGFPSFIPAGLGVKRGDEVKRDLWHKSELTFIKSVSGVGTKEDADAYRKHWEERHMKGIPGYEANVLPPRLEDIRNLPGAELAGFMPRRGDFDMEWDNDAEKIIADMEFSADDSPDDRKLKLQVIEIFNTKLDERERRKNFIVNHNLLNYRENQQKMLALPVDERHLIHRMRLFARFHSKEEHESFVQNILKEKRLRKEIAKLHMYRRLGIHSLADAERYELDKSRREYHKNAWLQKEAENKKAEAEIARATKENAEGSEIILKTGLDGSLVATTNQSIAIWKQYKGDSRKTRRGRDNSEDGKQMTESDQNANDSDNDSTKAKQEPTRNEFTIKDKPGYDLLSSKEAKLCTRLRLLPKAYLDAKKVLLAESFASGIVSPGPSNPMNRSIVKIDVEKRDNVIDFILQAGWIPSQPKSLC